MIAHTKNILMLSWEYPPHIVGGLARHVHALSLELSKLDNEIHVVTAKPSNSSDYEKQEGIHIHRVAPLNEEDPDFLAWIGGLNLAIIEESLSISRHISFDVVHTHDWLTGPAGGFLSKMLGIPLIATIHGTEFGRNKGVFTNLQQFVFSKEKELCRSAEEIIVCSDFMKDEVLRLLDVTSDRVSVIANGTAIEEVNISKLVIEELFPFLKDRKVVFSIGRMVKEKGFATIIEAANLLKQEAPELSFVIAGNGPLLETYRRKVWEMGLQDSVQFIGFISEEVRQALLKRADIAVFASGYEPFGLAAAEALAAGVPTILSRTGGMQGLIEDGKTGFHMEPGDEKDLAQKILWIQQNHSLAHHMAKSGQKGITEKFSWEHNAKATDTLYSRSITTFAQKEGIR
ncbi:glycosyltransferase family 4 protein [Mesobacillus subterraneus]|uniref:Glycosyltransferase family 1 protein n=1 Tax=Mesobacillus subterraneus TaxID=285983 RepID=A0A427TSU6_9BACI|nr:glycosyltransferase family 4 protein [Mesobacillus subterraneus]RSD27447.1 glycosyltransferase family 1 protein [Mesobacillus subterraneus]